MLRVASVSGWSGPSTRSRSGRSAWNSRSASRASPHSPVQWAMLLRVGERVRVVGAEHPLPVRQERLEQPQRLGGVAGLAGPVGDVVAGGERVRVVGAEHPLQVRQERLEQPQRLGGVAGLAGPVGDVAAGR